MIQGNTSSCTRKTISISATWSPIELGESCTNRDCPPYLRRGIWCLLNPRNKIRSERCRRRFWLRLRITLGLGYWKVVDPLPPIGTGILHCAGQGFGEPGYGLRRSQRQNRQRSQVRRRQLASSISRSASCRWHRYIGSNYQEHRRIRASTEAACHRPTNRPGW